MVNLKQNNISKYIQFGIMCDNLVLCNWQIRCIKNLLKLKNVSLKLIIVNDSKPKSISPLRLINKNLFFEIYQSMCLRDSFTFKKVDCTKLFQNVDIIRCKIKLKEKYSQYFRIQDIEKIKSYKLDFLLRFGFGIIRGEILNIAKYGIWSYHHDDERKYRGSPPCFWEIFHNDPITGVVLQKLTERLDAGIILKKGYFKTVKHSYRKNLEEPFLQSSIWPSQVCIDIMNGNADYINKKSSKTNAPIYRHPKNGQTLWFLLKIFLNKIKNIINNLFYHDIWNIGLVDSPIQSFLDKDFKFEIKWLPESKKNECFADPFGFIKDEKKVIFCERYLYNEERGEISFFEKIDTKFSLPKTIISPPYSLSYPYIIEYKNDIFCIPESAELNKILLYKAIDFPYKWQKAGILRKNIQVIDSTIFKDKDLWWLACAESIGISTTKLYLFYSNSIFGPWKEHSLNPVKIDIRSSRPGGTPFIFKGRLIRPAQDSSKTYGFRITLNEIIELTPTKFNEKIISIVAIDRKQKYNKGIHTISSFGDMTLIDAKRFGFKLKLFREFYKFLREETKRYFLLLFKKLLKNK